MKATVHFGLKLPIPGQQFSNREVHVTLEDDVKDEQGIKTLNALARKMVNAEMTTFGIPAKPGPMLD
jgi:hypothetical protein